VDGIFRRGLAQWPASRPRKHIAAISIASFHKREAYPFLRACHHCYFICSKEIYWKFHGKFLIDFYASRGVVQIFFAVKELLGHKEVKLP